MVKDKELRRGNLFKMTKAIFFFATPHRGLLFEDIRAMVGDGSSRIDLIQSIGEGQEEAYLQSFRRYAEEEHFGVVTVREMLRTKMLEQVCLHPEDCRD